jgi:hypothetical protein
MVNFPPLDVQLEGSVVVETSYLLWHALPCTGCWNAREEHQHIRHRLQCIRRRKMGVDMQERFYLLWSVLGFGIDETAMRCLRAGSHVKRTEPKVATRLISFS